MVFILSFTPITGAEPDWTQRPVLACIDPDWEPLEKITEDGHYVGIAADLLRLIFQRAQRDLLILPTKDWNESLEKSQSGECDILGLLNKTELRSQWLNFTRPYFIDPNVVITRNEHPYIEDLAQLNRHRVVLPTGTSIYEFIKRDHPEIDLIPVETEWEAFDLVDRGIADATLRSLTVAAYTIRNHGWFNLKIAGEIPDYKNLLRIGVRQEHTQLLEQLDAAIATLDIHDINSAINTHIPMLINYRYNWSLIVKITFISILVISLILIGVFFLYRSHKRLFQLKQTQERLLRDKEIMEEQLRESEHFYRSLVDTAHEGIAVIQNYRFVYANRHLTDMTGKTIEERKALPSFIELVTEPFQQQTLQYHQNRLKRESVAQRYQTQLQHTDGRHIDVEVSGIIVGWLGEPASLNFITDITERKRAEDKITYLANHDPLTGLANRRLLISKMENLIKRNIEFSIIFIDLNQFKPINDTWGHQVGDELLQAVAHRLVEKLGATDTFARIGGDEFVMLIEGSAVDQRLINIEQSFLFPFQLKENSIKISTSLGVAQYPRDGSTTAELIQYADKKMYQKKRSLLN
ncbi:diguanylate cyclase domain-containing protein [Vibrio cincinnatiensis]|uniref:diguanylate cyclase domain-containing protein n=1 Tax=Vibrio cincinnatiensis TaxID=675 RepID=UPI001FAB2082|nr:diguanylate cyclase [Vibrio cincinnatiensis]